MMEQNQSQIQILLLRQVFVENLPRPGVIIQKMTSENTVGENAYECPICLSPLLRPITLPCGHNFCEPCIKSKGFKVLEPLCPLCRRQIRLKLKYFQANLILYKLVQEKFGHIESYRQRQQCYERYLSSKRDLGLPARIFKRVKKVLKIAYRLLSIKLLLAVFFLLIFILFLRVRINIFNMEFPEQYKAKALQMVNKVKSEASLDFKFLLFSQFVRILFSNIIIR